VIEWSGRLSMLMESFRLTRTTWFINIKRC
jgi:hypothetical protein